MKLKYILWIALQWILAPCFGAKIRRMVHEQMAPTMEGRWLDVGCGPRSPAVRTLPGTLVGVDCVPDMLCEWRCEAIVLACATATALPFASESFDGVVCFGLLHHLNEADAATALVEMQRVARSGGMVLLLDNVKPSFAARRPLAALLRLLDHGHHIRTEEVLRRLLNRHQFCLGPRFTYSWAGLEGCWASFIRPEGSPSVEPQQYLG